MSIGALTGVHPADAGVSLRADQHNQQIGGAIGVAVATTVAATATNHYVQSHLGSSAFGGAALTDGFHAAFYVLAAVAAAGAALAALMIETRRSQPTVGHSGELMREAELEAA